MYIPISQNINKFYVNIEGTTYPVKKMLLNTQEVTGVEVYADYYSQYFTIESLEDNNVVTFTKGSGAQANTYSVYTNSTWTSFSDTQSWTLNTGDKLLFKAELTNDKWKYWNFDSTKTFDVYGNIMSLIYGDDFEGQDSLLVDLSDPLRNFEIFWRLFYNSKVVNAKNLKLPATNLTRYCYARMFESCTSLISAPELPATTLGAIYNASQQQTEIAWALSCYLSMFEGCTSLTTAPALPATSLASRCYESMFANCQSLIAAPPLPATSLASYCYQHMFRGCTSLVTPPVLPATTLANYCYQYMFQGCTSLTTAPELLATVLVDSCYVNMFYGCSLLNEVVCLATDISATDCLLYWLNNTASTGTFYKDSTMNGFVVGANVPSGWSIQNYN